MDAKPQDIDTKSVISMQELDPSPVDDSTPDLESLENGEYFHKPEEDKPKRTCGFPAPNLGLRTHRWDALRMLGPNPHKSQYRHVLTKNCSVGSSEILDLSTNGFLCVALR